MTYRYSKITKVKVNTLSKVISYTLLKVIIRLSKVIIRLSKVIIRLSKVVIR